MSQYITGTVTVTNASATVTGSGTLWVGNVTVGSLFTITGSSVPYIVGAVGSNTSLTLTSNYAGSTLAGQSYSITTSYTPILGIPYMERSDVDTQTIFKRAMLLLENLWIPFVNIVTTDTTQAITGAKTMTGANAFNGTLGATTPAAVTATTISVSGILNLSGANTGLEIGAPLSNTPYIDFHSGATQVDYDSRIIASLGTGVNGAGTLTYHAATHAVVGNLNVTNGMVTASGTITATDLMDVAGASSAVRSTYWIGRGNVATPVGDAFMYRKADNTLALGTMNADRLEISSTGLVGIGKTPSAGVMLDVAGRVDASSGFNGTLGATTPAAATVTSLNGGQLAGLRNRIINGNMDIWQRGSSFASMAVNTFSADRWITDYNGSGVGINVSRVAYIPPLHGILSRFVLRFEVTAAGSSNTYKHLYQKIESVYTLQNKTVTFSMRLGASSALTGVFIRFEQRFGTGGSPSATVTTLSSAQNIGEGLWSWTVALPSTSGKALGTNGDDALWVVISLPITGTYLTDISDVQLEEGSVATPFEHRPIGMELALCQRYVRVLGGTGIPAILGQAVVSAATTVEFSVPFAPPMRGTPTLTLAGTVGDININDKGVSIAATGVALSGAVTHHAACALILLTSTTGGLTAGRGARISVSNSTNIMLIAEL